jgi:serine/threonine protein kinase
VALVETEQLGGRYRLGELLGVGGMAEVRSAEDERLGRSVAVKLLREDLAGVAEVRARFEVEARASAGLAHPNIVAVYDVDVDDETQRPYLVMERLLGTTLADEIARRPLDPDRAIDVGLQVADALDVAHAAGIVHRDVKPGNVLHAGDGTWKVGDFGIAKSTEALDTLTTTGFVLCTPGYVAPERLAGEAATPASDLYSLGVVLYEALTGRRPFEADTPIGLAHLVRTADPPPLRELRPDVDPELARVVDAALARDPSRRFDRAAELRAALAALRGDGAVPVGSDPTIPLRRPPSTRTRAVPPDLVPARARGGSRPGARKLALLAVGAAALGWLVVSLATSDGVPEPGVAPTTGATDATVATDAPVPVEGPALPPPLEEALDRLEEAVAP